MSETRRQPLFSLVAAVVIILLLGHVSAQGGVTYVYDDLGRLVGVIDPSGNAAVYSYDAVGNVQSITRYSPNQIAVLNVSPRSGPIGTTVRISGTGFSATLSQNTVSFNGTTAAITSASTTQLVVTVPSPATTGPLTVTSPNGSASGGVFTVTSCNQPRVDAFTPGIAVAGTAVAVTGGCFDPTPQNDRPVVNVTPTAVPTSVSPTSLTIVVPPATASGHVSVATPTGHAVSG
jgi:YD repeat-containing protein